MYVHSIPSKIILHESTGRYFRKLIDLRKRLGIHPLIDIRLWEKTEEDKDISYPRKLIEFAETRKADAELASIIQNTFKLNPQTGSLFMFCGRQADRIKCLYWQGDGYILLYKRLEGGRYQWPRTDDELREITPQQFRWLMEGLSIYPKKVIQPVQEQLIF